MAYKVERIRNGFVIGDYDNNNGSEVQNRTGGWLTVGLSKTENGYITIDEDTIVEVRNGEDYTFPAGLGAGRKILAIKDPSTTIPTIIVTSV